MRLDKVDKQKTFVYNYFVCALETFVCEILCDEALANGWAKP
jgi:hypothetical protein